MPTKILGLAAGAVASTLFLGACASYDEDYRAGRCITWEQFLAERAVRRAR